MPPDNPKLTEEQLREPLKSSVSPPSPPLASPPAHFTFGGVGMAIASAVVAILMATTLSKLAETFWNIPADYGTANGWLFSALGLVLLLLACFAYRLAEVFDLAFKRRHFTKQAEDRYFQKDFDAAIKACNQLIELYNTYPPQSWLGCLLKKWLKQKKAGAYNNRGLVYLKKGDLKKAIEDYTRAIALKPDYALAYNGRGTAYFNKGKFDTAIQNYKKAIDCAPDDELKADAHSNRGNAYFRRRGKGDLTQAIEDYTQAIDCAPNNELKAMAYNNRGNACVMREEEGDLTQAIEDYTQAITLKPDHADAYNNRGNAYLRRGEKGDLTQAIANYDQAIRLKPDFTEAYTDRGAAYAGKGDLNLAIQGFRKTIELKPDDVLARKNLVLVCGKYAEKNAENKSATLQLLDTLLGRLREREKLALGQGQEERADAYEKAIGRVQALIEKTKQGGQG